MVKATPSHLTLQEAGQLPGMVPISQPVCLLLLPRSADRNCPLSLPSALCSVPHIQLSSKKGCLLGLCVSGHLESKFCTYMAWIPEYGLGFWETLCDVFDLGIDLRKVLIKICVWGLLGGSVS